jgi:hypothetical protein
MKFTGIWITSAMFVTGVGMHSEVASASWLFGGMASAIANSVQLGETDNCIAPTAKVGDVIKMTENYVGIVKSIAGPSAICDDASQVRARVDVRLSEAVRTAEHVICVSRGLGKGDRVKDVGLGEMEIKRVTSSPDCASDPKTPIQAVAVSTQGPSPSAPVASVPAPLPPTPAAPAPVPVVAKPTPLKAADTSAAPDVSPKQATSQTAEKLRELAAMRKDGLITQEDYDSKKKELLKSF